MERLARSSLIAVWLGTAVASVVTATTDGMALLSSAGVPAPWQPWIIGAGAGVDAVLGLAMWLRPSRAVYAAALAMMGVMTAVGTALLPGLWGHPLGPLLKNLPMAVLLWQLMHPARTP